MTYEPGRIAFFDPAGNFDREMGRLGGGPGEYRGPVYSMQGPRGSTWLVDMGNLRVTVLDGAGKVLNAFRYSGHIGYTAPLDSAHVIVLGTMTREGEGIQPGRFHIMNKRGDVVRSFGDLPLALQSQRVALRPNGNLLAAHADEYVMQEWELDGDLVRILTRHLDWFAGTPGPGRNSPQLIHAPVDEQGRAWVTLKRPRTQRAPEAIRGFSDLSKLASGVIEVVDLNSNTVIAEGKYRHPYLMPVYPFTGQFLEAVEDSSGYVSFVVWQAEIVASR